MSHNFYSEIHLHAVWHTKQSMSLLTPEVEPLVHRYLRHRLIEKEGVPCHAVGGTETHVHVVFSIEPSVRISELIGRLKGAAAHEVNQRFGRGGKVFEWQRGYGVVSF